MGLHRSPTSNGGGLGQKVEHFISGLGAFKTAYDVGHVLYDVGKVAGPAIANAGRAALPLLSAAL